MTTNSYLIRGSRVRDATSSPFRASDHHHCLAPPFLAVLLVFARSFIIHIVLALYLLVAPTPSSPSFLTCPTACTAMRACTICILLSSAPHIAPSAHTRRSVCSRPRPYQLSFSSAKNRHIIGHLPLDVPRDAQVGRWTLIRPRDSDSVVSAECVLLVISARSCRSLSLCGLAYIDPRHILPPRSSMVTPPLGRSDAL